MAPTTAIVFIMYMFKIILIFILIQTTLISATTNQLIKEFKIIVDKTAILDGSDFIVTLYWNNNEYSCIFSPFYVFENDELICDNIKWYKSPTQISRFYAKFEYSGNRIIQFKTLNITNYLNQYYTINTFCIPSTMTHTFIKYQNFNAPSSKCNAFEHKNSYSQLAIGGNTKFTLFYVDFRQNIGQFPDRLHEGSVRPPKIAQIGIESRAPPNQQITVSVQWDISLYKCTFNAATHSSCYTQNDPVSCPGIKSNFWISVYNPGQGSVGNVLPLEAIFVEDEVGNSYYLRHFCLEPSSLTDAQYGPSNTYLCSDTPWPTYTDVQSSQVKELLVGGSTWYNNWKSSMLAAIAPNEIFDYPMEVSPPSNIKVKVLNGGGIYPDDINGKYGWNEGEYGYEPPKCPNTNDPTMAPTFSPTLSPTPLPTDNPSKAPSNSPSTDPTIDPTIDPSMYPTENPTIDPTVIPTLNPSFSPTVIPTLAPSIAPTAFPTMSPTNAPTTECPMLQVAVINANGFHGNMFNGLYVSNGRMNDMPYWQSAQLPHDKNVRYDGMRWIINGENSDEYLYYNSKKHITAIRDLWTYSLSNSLISVRIICILTLSPTNTPTLSPSVSPSFVPTESPTVSPSKSPSIAPSNVPTFVPSNNPSLNPSNIPTLSPSVTPSLSPSVSPSLFPSANPSNYPTNDPTIDPTVDPTVNPSLYPSEVPSVYPTENPTFGPSKSPTMYPTNSPTMNPSLSPILDEMQSPNTQRNEWLLSSMGMIEIIVGILFILACCCVVLLCGYIIGNRSKSKKDTMQNVQTPKHKKVSIPSHDHSVQLGRVQTYEVDVEALEDDVVEGLKPSQTLALNDYDDLEWSRVCNVDNEEFVDFIDETKIFRA